MLGCTFGKPEPCSLLKLWSVIRDLKRVKLNKRGNGNGQENENNSVNQKNTTTIGRSDKENTSGGGKKKGVDDGDGTKQTMKTTTPEENYNGTSNVSSASSGAYNEMNHMLVLSFAEIFAIRNLNEGFEVRAFHHV